MILASKQREYQKRNMARGLCIQCPSESLPKKGRCFRHQLFYKLRQYGMAKGHLSDKNSNRREKLAASLLGRYTAISAGFLAPVDEAQRMKDAVEIRLRLHITWGGVRGVRKLARVMRSFEEPHPVT
jgi:hypothetical protein